MQQHVGVSSAPYRFAGLPHCIMKSSLGSNSCQAPTFMYSRFNDRACLQSSTTRSQSPLFLLHMALLTYKAAARSMDHAVSLYEPLIMVSDQYVAIEVLCITAAAPGQVEGRSIARPDRPQGAPESCGLSVIASVYFCNTRRGAV
jgi:hypothetical protein